MTQADEPDRPEESSPSPEHGAVLLADAGPRSAAAGEASSRSRVGRALASVDPAWWVLAGIIVLWMVVFGQLVWRRHDRFSSFGFDMAIFDQAVWLLSRFGSQFITIRGLPVFGHHGSPALYLLVPFYWFGAGPHFLNLLQVAAMATGAVPVFLLARHRLANKWFAVLLAAVYLAHPSLQFMAWELFHPEAMAIPCLLLAYWFAIRKRWGWFAVSCVVAVGWKEDVALAVLVLGLVIALRGDLRVGLITAGVALGWFLFVTRFLIPEVSGNDAFYLSFFSDLGDTPGEMVGNVVRDPSLVGRRLVAPDAKSYLWKMTAPFGFVPLLAPDILFIGVPQTLVNLLSVNDFTRKITYHYAALPLTALTLATVEGIAFFSRNRPTTRGVLMGVVAASALAATISWGPSPIGHEYRRGYWPLGEDSRHAAKVAALEVVPGKAGVSATYQFDSHLTHRERVYEFPNPFKPSNWGVRDENYPSPNQAEWLAVDTQLLGQGDRKVFDDLFATGQFEKRFERDGIVVAERTNPAPTGTPGSGP